MGTLGAVRFLPWPENCGLVPEDLEKIAPSMGRIFQTVSPPNFASNTTEGGVLGFSTPPGAGSSDPLGLPGGRGKGARLGPPKNGKAGIFSGLAASGRGARARGAAPRGGLRVAAGGVRQGGARVGGGPENGVRARFLSLAPCFVAAIRSRQTLPRLFSAPGGGPPTHQPPPATPTEPHSVGHAWALNGVPS